MKNIQIILFDSYKGNRDTSINRKSATFEKHFVLRIYILKILKVLMLKFDYKNMRNWEINIQYYTSEEYT